ncbi:MAG: hypothetical protein MI741_22965 [Rhodospirillales bacterium]|nr:hypothetical protein [Rhodospirillales bacterium]
MIRLLPVLLLGAVLLTGCGDEQPTATQEVSSGKIDKGRYHNDFFGLSIPIPDGWHVADEETQQDSTERGDNLLIGDDDELAAAMAELEKHNATLLSLRKRAPNAQVFYDPNLAIYAERISHLTDIKSKKDYLLENKRMMQASQATVSFPSDIYTEQIGGKEFHVLDSELEIMGVKIFSRAHVTLINGYAVVVTTTYASDEGEAELKEIVQTLAFE